MRVAFCEGRRTAPRITRRAADCPVASSRRQARQRAMASCLARPDSGRTEADQPAVPCTDRSGQRRSHRSSVGRGPQRRPRSSLLIPRLQRHSPTPYAVKSSCRFPPPDRRFGGAPPNRGRQDASNRSRCDYKPFGPRKSSDSPQGQQTTQMRASRANRAA
jgi:hypothetical protein